MLQSLLEHRFKLKVTRETRELPQHELTVAKDKGMLAPPSEKPMSITIAGKTSAPSRGSAARPSGVMEHI